MWPPDTPSGVLPFAAEVCSRCKEQPRARNNRVIIFMKVCEVTFLSLPLLPICCHCCWCCCLLRVELISVDLCFLVSFPLESFLLFSLSFAFSFGMSLLRRATDEIRRTCVLHCCSLQTPFPLIINDDDDDDDDHEAIAVQDNGADACQLSMQLLLLGPDFYARTYSLLSCFSGILTAINTTSTTCTTTASTALTALLSLNMSVIWCDNVVTSFVNLICAPNRSLSLRAYLLLLYFNYLLKLAAMSGQSVFASVSLGVSCRSIIFQSRDLEILVTILDPANSKKKKKN